MDKKYLKKRQVIVIDDVGLENFTNHNSLERRIITYEREEIHNNFDKESIVLVKKDISNIDSGINVVVNALLQGYPFALFYNLDIENKKSKFYLPSLYWVFYFNNRRKYNDLGIIIGSIEKFIDTKFKEGILTHEGEKFIVNNHGSLLIEPTLRNQSALYRDRKKGFYDLCYSILKKQTTKRRIKNLYGPRGI